MLGGVCPDGGSSSSAPGGGSASVGSDEGMVDAVEGGRGTAGNGGALGGDTTARSWTAPGGLAEGVMGPALKGVQFFNCAGVSVSTLAPDASRHW